MTLTFFVRESNGSIGWGLPWYLADKAPMYISGMLGNLNASNAMMGFELRKATMLEF